MMKPPQVACLLLSMVLGEVKVTVADYGIQPVDAVLFIDGAPTYLRLTNSTSLETVYSCVLENSQNVNFVIMSTQIKGVQMDVGQVEENVIDVIRLLSAEAVSNGRTLWKSPEELKLFKMRLARYLTSNYYDSKQILEPDMYLNFKSQRSADWLYNNRGHQSPPNIHHMHPVWGEQKYATREPRRQFPIPAAIYGSTTYFNTPEPLGQSMTVNISTAYAFIPTQATPVPERAPTQNAEVVSHNHGKIPTESSVPFRGVERHTTLSTPSMSTSEWFSNRVAARLNINETGIHPLKALYVASPYSMYGYPKTEPEATTAKDQENDQYDQEESTIPIEGLFNMNKSNEKDVAQTDENDKSFEESSQSRTVSRKRFKTGRNVTEAAHNSDVRPSDESSTEMEKPRKPKGKKRNGKKRVAKSRQQSSMMMSDPNGGV